MSGTGDSMDTATITGVTWVKSSHSGPTGGLRTGALVQQDRVGRVPRRRAQRRVRHSCLTALGYCHRALPHPVT